MGGDVNFIIQEKEHETFKRKGADLLITKTLSINEALCGFEWVVKHLDGREIAIKSKPGEVIRPEATTSSPYVKIVPNEGMPSHGNPFVKGNLYVLFRVEFPKDGELSKKAIYQLKQLCPIQRWSFPMIRKRWRLFIWRQPMLKTLVRGAQQLLAITMIQTTKKEARDKCNANSHRGT